MDSISRDRGIDFHSTEVARQIVDEFPDTRRRGGFDVESRSWRLSELEALERTGQRYSSVLGDERKRSGFGPIRSSRQNVRRLGAVNWGVGDDDRSRDPSTRGETFRNRNMIAFFSPMTSQPVDQQQRITDHEFAHSELQPHFLADFKARRSSSPMRHETATSSYGSTAPTEDFAEAFAHHLNWPTATATSHPHRSAFASSVMAQVRPPPPAPAPAPTTTTTTTTATTTVTAPRTIP